MIQTSLFVPPNSPADSHYSHSCSGSSSPSGPSLVRQVPVVGPEQVTPSSAIPIDELLSDSGIKPNSKSGQSSSQNLELSTKDKDNKPTIIPSHSTTIYQPSTAHHFHPTLVLQNKGSVARDHLASERTFLAYVRTSLGMASAGIALVQLFTIADLVSKSTNVPLPTVNQKLQKFATPLGLSALGMSLIVLLIGEFFYFIFSFHDRFQTQIYYYFLFFKKKVHLDIFWYSTLFRRTSFQLPAYLLFSSHLASVRLQPLPLEPSWVGKF